ncbi:MAG: hypothetical protein ACJ79H_06720 [Myxococcales bacterium]
MAPAPNDAGVPDGSSEPPPDAGQPADAGAPPDASTALPPPPDAGPPEAFCALNEGGGPGDVSEGEPGLSTDCRELVPDFPGVPPQITFEMGTHSACTGATSDGEGTLGFGTVSAGSPRSTVFLLHRPDGGALARISADSLAPQPHGFAVHEQDWEFPHGSALRFADGSGKGPQQVSNEIVAVAGVPGGGVVAVERPWNIAHWWITTHRFDAAGERVGPPSDVLEGSIETRPQSFAVGAATDGSALVVVGGEPFGDPDSLYGIWIDDRGNRVGDAFQVTAAKADGLLIRPLLDGSVAVRAEGMWRARIANRARTVRDPPAWLSALAGRDFQLRKHRRVNRGYVVLFDPQLVPSRGCKPLVDIRAPAGNRCGTLAVAESVVRADVGEDGTLIWFRGGPPCSFGICCQWRWWTGLLR